MLQTYSRLWTGGQIKPQGVPKIDWSSPLTLGMTDCLLWNEGAGAPLNLAAPSINTTRTGNPTWVMTENGPAGYSTGGAAFNIPNHGNIVAGDFSIRVIFRPVTLASSYIPLFDKGASNAREIGVFLNTIGTINYVTIGASGVTDGFVATGMTAGSIWDFVITRTGGTSFYYVNGQLKSSLTSTGTAAQPSSALSFGANPSTGSDGLPDIYYITAQIWNRALPAGQILKLYSDPYCFLIPQEGEWPLLFDPSVPVLGAVYLDPTQLGTNIVLSNSNLTATQMAAATANTRAIAHHASGKYYCEFTVDVTGDMQVGVCNAVMPLTEYLGQDNTHSIGVDDGGGWLGAGGTTTAPGLIAGHVYGLAIDINNKKAWVIDITAGGNWNSDGSANPVTGAGGATFSTIS